jgi:predicted GIY-YIG superfamily endonuclease
MLNHSRIVFVMRSLNHPDRYYTGLTDNVERRVAVHNSGLEIHRRLTPVVTRRLY